MTPTVMDRAWEILGRVLILDGDAFLPATMLSRGLMLAVIVVLLAGLSLAVGQSIILFINRVQPIRFIFSLFISAVLYLFEFLFLVLSTWLICLLPGSVQVSLPVLTIVLGLSYTPLLFSFLGALPYFGLPLLRLLSVWHLLAMVVGFSAVTNIGASFAFGYVAVGWFVKTLLENTIGQPIAQLGKVIADRTAGVTLATNREDLVEQVRSRFTEVSSPLIPASQTAAPPLPLSNLTGETRDRGSAPPPSSAPQAPGIRRTPAPRQQNRDPLAKLAFQASFIPEPVKVALGLLLLVALFVMVFILLRPIRNSFFGWYDTLPRIPRLIFDLSWIGGVGVVFAGLLAPFETLGWWAGWFGDDVDTSQAIAPPPPTERSADPNAALTTRYVIYLDGVGQSGEAHTPDVEEFLTALQPALPEEMRLVRGLMMYSVLNKPLNEDRPLTFLWNLADKMRWKNPTALLGLLVNVRNAIIVMVSADQRYGPIYNRGIAQVLYNGLVERGYQSGSGIPITLVGYSGGAQMSVASAPYLKQALGAPIDVISIGGVMSANNNFFKLEHLYHLVGEKDVVEKFGPILFAGRWKLLPLSYWNRAKRKGKISLLSTGPVGHQVPGGYMDPNAFLPDGRSYLQATVDWIVEIVTGTLPEAIAAFPVKVSNYAIFKQAPFNDVSYYPLDQSVDEAWYPAIAPWMGRLILPSRDQRQCVRGVLFEVHHAAPGYEQLVGQTVVLRWANTPFMKDLVQAARRDVHFSANAEYSSRYEGLIHPERVNQWQQVGPLESLAGSHPTDDIVVMLNDPVAVEALDSRSVDRLAVPHLAPVVLRIQSQPVQITGRYYALVQFVEAIAGTDQFRVVHFNRATRQFDGLQDIVRLPPVVESEGKSSAPSTTRDLEKSPFNETGWFIYGAEDASGRFVVQALGPRALFQLQPNEVIFGKKQSYRYIRQRAWANIKAQKGRISSVLCVAQDETIGEPIQAAIQAWQEGDRALLIHVYGGIGGNKAEPAATTPLYFGHFAFGVAQVIREPLSDELRFDLRYYQVYTHNTDGLVAGTLHWSRYMGDRQFGWLGCRPVCDILIKQPAFTDAYDFSLGQRSALDYMLLQLEVMTSRYRIGDGTGGTYVGAASNCAQDSNQALFASLRQMERQIAEHTAALDRWRNHHPEQAERLQSLLSLQQELRLQLQPLGGPKSSWERNEYNLGTTLEDGPIRNLRTGLGSWRTLLPRLASDTVVKVFLDHGATVWVLRTNQIGGYDPDIEPVAPMTL
jgi:predicted Abi (CAAX) family protease